MQPMSQIRKWHLDQMRQAITITQVLLAGISQQDATSIRDGGDGWTVAEVMGHLLDFEPIYMERCRLIVETDMPDLPFPDHEALVAAGDYNNKATKDIVSEWVAIRQAHIAFLQTIPDDQWERPAKHPTRGAFTLHDQLFLTVWHDMNHLEQIAHIMLGK